jgi:hypothetical protein
MNFNDVLRKIKRLKDFKEIAQEKIRLINFKTYLQNNQNLKNIHAGKRCFLVGNGPSINNQDLTLLKNEIAIVASSFFRHPQAKAVNPSYWIFADPYFWREPERYFIPAHRYALDKDISTKLFVPFSGYPYFNKFDMGPLIDLHYYHCDSSRDITNQNITNDIDFSLRIPQFAQNTMTVCLMLALYLGCNPIYFIGCDRDYWNITEEEYKTYSVRHFYEDPKQNTFGEHIEWNRWLVAKARTEYEYEQLKQYSNTRGIDIYNATPGGLFDSFPRVNYESLFLNE